MSLVSALKTLLIPRKSSAKPTDLDTDWRAIEVWAQQVVAAIKSISGGGSVVAITSPFSTIDITDPAGPTVEIDVAGVPFLPYTDANDNVGYGKDVFASLTSGGVNTAVGYRALRTLTSGISDTGIGNLAGFGLTTGTDNTFVGDSSGQGISAGDNNTAVGSHAGPLTDVGNTVAVGNSAQAGADNATAIGTGALATGAGSVAIGRDSASGGLAGVSASTNVQNEFALGTARHVILFSNSTTGGGSASLGANCPAGTLTHPTAWIAVRLATGGTLGYIPVWE